MNCSTPRVFAALCTLLGACASPGPTVPDTLPVAHAPSARDPSRGNPVDRHETEHFAVPAEPPPQQARSPWQGNLNVLLGMRFLDDNIWSPLEDQPAIGLELDMRPRNSNFGFEAGLVTAYDWDTPGGISLESWTLELYVGPRITFDEPGSTVHPYVGTGLSWMYTDFETALFPSTASDHDNSFAAYAHAGIYFNPSPGTNVGVDVRSMFGSDLQLFGTDADGDYLQVALVLGGGW